MSTEPSAFFCRSGICDERLARGMLSDQRVRCAVVGRRRPVLLDRRVRRHGEPIGLAAVEGFAVLVLDADQVELPRAETLDADEGEAVGDAAGIDRIWSGSA